MGRLLTLGNPIINIQNRFRGKKNQCLCYHLKPNTEK